MMERVFAVAVRDGQDLFLWFRVKRARLGDIYYMIPTGGSGPDWKKWDPHGLIIEEMISEPKRLREMYDKLPASKRDAIAKRDGTTKTP